MPRRRDGTPYWLWCGLSFQKSLQEKTTSLRTPSDTEEEDPPNLSDTKQKKKKTPNLLDHRSGRLIVSGQCEGHRRVGVSLQLHGVLGGNNILLLIILLPILQFGSERLVTVLSLLRGISRPQKMTLY